jgi:hypothetical protein
MPIAIDKCPYSGAYSDFLRGSTPLISTTTGKPREVKYLWAFLCLSPYLRAFLALLILSQGMVF